jgi:hemoglobin/transferrin/lactoferrin receptor protein
MKTRHEQTAMTHACIATLSSRHALRIALMASSAIMTPALAQDAATADAVTLPTVRIEATAAQALLGNTEVTGQELEDRNASTVKQVFAGKSSVTVSGGAPIAQKVFVNGIEESLLSVTIDGARQNKSAFHHTGNVLLDPTLLKRVDVTRGLAPADAGPGGLGGSIAYETKDARDMLAPDQNLGSLVIAGADTNGTDLRGSLTLFGRSGGFEALLSGTSDTGEDYEDGDGETVPGTEPDLAAYVGKFAYGTEGGNRVSFSASRTEDKGGRSAQAGPGGIFFIRPDFAEVVGRENVSIDGYARRDSYTLTYTDESPEGWLAPTLQLSYNEQEVDASGVSGENTSLSGTAKNQWQLGNGQLIGGIDFFDEAAKGQGHGPGPFGSSGEETMWNVGLFAQVLQDLSERVSVSYGVRLDAQQFEGADGSKHESQGLSGNGAVDIILIEGLTLNAGLASTWGGYELGEAAVVNFGEAWTYDGLTTSRGDSARLGLRYENGPWGASGALFKTEIDDISAVLPTGGDRGAKTDLSSAGFDGSLSWTGSQGYAALNYTYADVELDGEAISSTAYYYGRPLGSIFGLEGAWDPYPGWRIGGTAQIVLDNDDTEFELPGYEVLNLFAAYWPRQLAGLELRLDVYNVFDETYQSRSSDGIGQTNVVALNEPGRTFGLTARWQF